MKRSAFSTPKQSNTFREFIAAELEYNSGKCSAFALKAGTNCGDALDNSDDIFRSAAMVNGTLKVLASLANAEEKGESEASRIDFLIDYLARDRQHMSRWPKCSTSEAGNFYHRCQLSATAELIELLGAWKEIKEGK